MSLFFGTVVAVLAVIGALAVVILGIQFLDGWLDGRSEKVAGDHYDQVMARNEEVKRDRCLTRSAASPKPSPGTSNPSCG